MTAAVRTAWRRGTGRPGRVGGIRVPADTVALLIIHGGRDPAAGDAALNSSGLLNVRPCWRFQTSLRRHAQGRPPSSI